MPPKIKVVLFEDTTETRSEILKALEHHLSGEGSVVPFERGRFEETSDEAEGTYEDRLESILRKSPYDEATLILADRDLSKSQDSGFGGLSVNSVAAAGRRLAIPVCSYARQLEPDDDYAWRGRWEEGHIVLRLSEGEDKLASQGAVAARGFSEIAARLPQLDRKANNSPAKLLAALLGKPEYSDKIALYAVGDQNRLTGIPRDGKQEEDWARKVAYFLGYWLWESLLRYPGVMVNDVAAASHLNIETEAFRRADVQAVFEEAVYHGPFASNQQPQWWRGLLDDIVASQNFTNGLELVHQKVDAEVDRSHCCVDPSIPAGYYCVISGNPVSLENSKGGLSWFPRGADLTRVSNPKFEEYGPWLGS